MESVFCRGGDYKQGLHISFGESTILQAVGCYACGSCRTEVSGHNATTDQRTRSEKCKNGNGWINRLLHIAQKIRVSEWQENECCSSCDESTVESRGGISILCFEDHVKRRGRAEIANTGSKCRLGTILPDIDENGYGVIGK